MLITLCEVVLSYVQALVSGLSCVQRVLVIQRRNCGMYSMTIAQTGFSTLKGSLDISVFMQRVLRVHMMRQGLQSRSVLSADSMRQFHRGSIWYCKS